MIVSVIIKSAVFEIQLWADCVNVTQLAGE